MAWHDTPMRHAAAHAFAAPYPRPTPSAPSSSLVHGTRLCYASVCVLCFARESAFPHMAGNAREVLSAATKNHPFNHDLIKIAEETIHYLPL